MKLFDVYLRHSFGIFIQSEMRARDKRGDIDEREQHSQLYPGRQESGFGYARSD
jgi:hypothetical protein